MIYDYNSTSLKDEDTKVETITLDEQGGGKNKWKRAAPRERNLWREAVDNEEAHPEIEDDQGILDAIQEGVYEEEVFADEEGPR